MNRHQDSFQDRRVVLDTLVYLSDREQVFERNGRLMHSDEDGRLVPVSGPLELRELLSTVRQYSDAPPWHPIERASDGLLGQVLRQGQWSGVSSINGLHHGPALVPYDDEGGTGLVVGGQELPYNAKHRAWFGPHGLWVEPPSWEEVEAARDLLLNELLGDFPFASQADRANALAMLLTPFLLHYEVRGPAPLFKVDAPRHGTGKTLLARVVLWVYDQRVHELVLPRDERGVAGLIGGVLREGSATALLDNVRGNVDSQALASMLTSTSWGRASYGRERVWLNRTTWAMTSNGATLSEELTRRTVLIQLDAAVEHPERRTGFRHPELEEWQRDHRVELQTAACHLALWWSRQGRPRVYEPKVMGSFEAWEAVMRGLLESVGVEGFLENVDRRDEANVERPEGIALVETVREVMGLGVEFTAKELDEKVRTMSHHVHHVPDGARALGKRLGQWKDRPVGGFVLRKVPRAREADAWRLDESVE